ncbi:argininosuccinate lyase, partial [Burkholderia sp. Tr-20355]|nr:argininosuccinate lyase [Burkholderia sp. Tr-20355]
VAPGVGASLRLDAAVAERGGAGGRQPARVREQIGRLSGAIERQAAWAADYRGPSC